MCPFGKVSLGGHWLLTQGPHPVQQRRAEMQKELFPGFFSAWF